MVLEFPLGRFVVYTTITTLMYRYLFAANFNG